MSGQYVMWIDEILSTQFFPLYTHINQKHLLSIYKQADKVPRWTFDRLTGPYLQVHPGVIEIPEGPVMKDQNQQGETKEIFFHDTRKIPRLIQKKRRGKERKSQKFKGGVKK